MQLLLQAAYYLEKARQQQRHQGVTLMVQLCWRLCLLCRIRSCLRLYPAPILRLKLILLSTTALLEVCSLTFITHSETTAL